MPESESPIDHEEQHTHFGVTLNKIVYKDDYDRDDEVWAYPEDDNSNPTRII